MLLKYFTHYLKWNLTCETNKYASILVITCSFQNKKNLKQKIDQNKIKISFTNNRDGFNNALLKSFDQVNDLWLLYFKRLMILKWRHDFAQRFQMYLPMGRINLIDTCGDFQVITLSSF